MNFIKIFTHLAKLIKAQHIVATFTFLKNHGLIKLSFIIILYVISPVFIIGISYFCYYIALIYFDNNLVYSLSTSTLLPILLLMLYNYFIIYITYNLTLKKLKFIGRTLICFLILLLNILLFYIILTQSLFLIVPAVDMPLYAYIMAIEWLLYFIYNIIQLLYLYKLYLSKKFSRKKKLKSFSYIMIVFISIVLVVGIITLFLLNIQ